MLELLSKNWWTFVVRGLVAILFGLLAFMMPGITLASLILVYGAYVLVDGILGIVAAFGVRSRGLGFPWSVFLIGLVGILAGIATFMYPGLTALVLLYFIAAWSVMRGIFEIITAIQLRKEIEGEGWLIFGGVMSVIFGFLLFTRPGAGALAVLWMIGAFAIVLGIVEILLGFKLKGFGSGAPAHGVRHA